MVRLTDNFQNIAGVDNQKKPKTHSGMGIKPYASFLGEKNYAAYSVQNLQAYSPIKKSKLSFGKRIEEHRSWGVNILNNDDPNRPLVKFKVWAPYADEVIVEVRNPKDKVALTPKEFRSEGLRNEDTWAGEWHMNTTTKDEKSHYIKLEPSKEHPGAFEGTEQLNTKDAMYRFVLKKDGEEYAKLKDPVSKCQPHIFSWSQVYSQDSFSWGEYEKEWLTGNHSERVSDLCNEDNKTLTRVGLTHTAKDGKNYLPPSALVTAELHIGTATKDGDLVSLKKEIDKIVKDGIFNSILLMPVEGTYDNNWGYDGVDKYSVTRSIGDANGKKNAVLRNNLLKEIVKYCHEKKINVGLDWVPSHMFASGPTAEDAQEQGIVGKQIQSGFILNKFGAYDKPGEWGGITFNLEDNEYNTRSRVRDYLVNIPLYWVENYHFDFLRADQTPQMNSNYSMKQVAAEVKHHFPHTVIHWEDHRTQDGLTRELRADELNYNNTEKHCDFIKAAEYNNVTLHNIGGNEHWDFAFSHSIEAMLRNKKINEIAPSISNLAKNMMDTGGTKYVLSHDEMGNDNGARLITKIVSDQLNIWDHLQPIAGESASSRSIRGYNAAESIAKGFLFNKKYWPNNFNKICQHYKLENISIEQASEIVKKAEKLHKVGLGVMYMAPGSKMIFQGDEYGEINSFRFTRKQAFDEPSQDKQKGYDVKKAWNHAKLNPEHHTVEGIKNFSIAMSDLLNRNEALRENQPFDKLMDMVLIEDNTSKVLGTKRFNFKGNEVIALYNFSDTNYEKYDIKNEKHLLPDGNWVETINSNPTKFGGDNSCTNAGKIFKMDGMSPATISIPAQSVVILEKANDKGKVYNGTPIKLS